MKTQIGLRYASVFAVLSELVDIGIVVLNEAREIDFASGRARALLGCDKEAGIAGCPSEVQRAIEELIDQVSPASSTSAKSEVRYKRNGRSYRLHLEAHPVDEADCTGVLLLVRDVERMRKLATDIRLSAQFRNTRRLFPAVADDLKQPITAILLHLDLLREVLDKEETTDGQPAPGMRSVRIIKEQVTELHRALNLLSEEIYPAETEERGFSLRDVLQDVIRLIEPQAASQNVVLDTDLGGHAARMSGSRQRVKQALLNLAVNGLDAMPQGGKLRLSLTVDRGVATIRMCDSGSGIEPEVLPHIFEMHYTTKESGTGAGLFVAREVFVRHSGHIVIEETSEDGTCVRATLAVSDNNDS